MKNPIVSFPICVMLIVVLQMDAGPVFGQSSNSGITGKVKDETSGELLHHASVSLLNPVDSVSLQNTVSDSISGFSFSAIKPGRYILQCSYTGFQIYYSDVFITGTASKLDITILMKRSSGELNEVVVEKKRTVIFDGNKIIINPKNMAGASTGTALDLLKTMPGVMVDQNETVSLNGRSDVTLMINDRKRTMSPMQAAILLRSIPAASVRQVEISNGKSAMNDAAGAGGTINIITNKPLANGYNVELYGAAIVDRYVSQSYNGTLNLQKKKLSIFTSAGYNRGYSYSRYNGTGLYNKMTPLATTTTDAGNTNALNNSLYADLSVDYKIDEKSVIGIAGNTYFGGANIRTNLGSAVTGARNYNTANLSSSEDDDNLNSFDILYTFSADSGRTKLKVDLGYLQGHATARPYFVNVFTDPAGAVVQGPFLIEATIPLNGDQYIAQVDFERRFNKKSLFQAGVKFSSGQVSNDVRYDTIRNGIHYPDLSRTEKLAYEEKIAAAYASYRLNVSQKVGITVGLRYENTSMRNISYNPEQVYNRNFGNLFPSASITYNGKGFRSTLNYNRSITRPYYGYLNPYVKYINEFMYQVGNAELKPSFSNSLILTNSIRDFIFLNVGYYGVTDNILLYRQQVANSTTTMIRPENVMNYDAVFASLTSYFSFMQSRYEGSVNLYWFSYQSHIKPGFTVTDMDTRRLGRVVVSTSQTYKITKKLSAEAMYSFYGPNRINQIEVKSRWQLGAGMRYKAFSDACTISAFVADLFYTMPEERLRYYDNFESVSSLAANTRRFTLSVSVNLGKLQQSFDKSTSTKKESSRYKEN